MMSARVGEPISVVPYDRGWPLRFDAEGVLLERVLARWLDGGIHHVGSTAVPGLAAKPVIDMVAGVRDLEDALAAFDALHAESYLYAPHRPGIAHHFDKPSLGASNPGYGLHLTESGSDLWRERLAFRDSLRLDAALASEYEALKLGLAHEHREDIAAYTAGKRAFVSGVLAVSGLRVGRR